MNRVPSHPVLSLEDAKRFEAELFSGDEQKEWSAMCTAGAAVANAALADFEEFGKFPSRAGLLVLVGKGHNGGDALIAARRILDAHADAQADVWLVFGEREMRPLAARAYRELVQSAPARVRLINRAEILQPAYAVLLDGVFGFQFRPPLAPEIRDLFGQINRHAIRFRAAIDLPSGIGDEGALRADFTYATGSVKTPVLEERNRAAVGRRRYLDLGFFDAQDDKPAGLMQSTDRVLTAGVFSEKRRFRDPLSDKRTYGHVFLLGGSRSYSGAALMSAMAAVRSGAGLVTAFVPETFAPAFAARVPEVIWVGWPETPSGGLALEGLHLLRERLDRANALLIGPGVGREPEVLALMADVAKLVPVPLVVDADALQTSIIEVGTAPRILTPHAGEFARIAGNRALRDFAHDTKSVTVLKGPITQISEGLAVYHSCAGGPVLARGGSGDILAGLVAGLLAQKPDDLLAAACGAVAWQGRSADLLARAHGQVAVQTTQILDFLANALRNEGP
ncbi:MAG: NAD(P)H-hydrate dehydratase [Nibricoccus sp.]